MPEIKPASKIIGIQFSILSPEEIRKQSVVEVTSRDTYINNKPVIGGLFDPRMGVLEPGTVCPTDGMSYIDTPGYFGHIELARPVFFIQHIKEIVKISRCICFKCSKLLMNKHQHKHVLEMRPEHRWGYVFAQASKAKRCGEQTEDGCGCKQPDKIKHEGMANIFAVWEDMGNNVDKTKQKVTIKMTPEIVLKLFQRISDEDVHFMGFSPVFSHPAWMVCTVLPIAPPAVRPSVKHDAQQRSEDDLTHIYSNIIKTNNFLKDKLAAGSDVNASAVEMSTEILQHSVAMIANNKIKGVAPMAQRSGRPLQCIMGRINSKNGRIRGNLMGKRVDFSARSVITGDPNLSVRQIGVPMKIAKNITKPVTVNDRNRDFLMQLVQNGPDEWPGAKILERRNGVNVSLRYIDRTHLVLENGDIVHRHMMDGDMVLFNRQPSLHRMSMMGHIVKVMPVGDTFRMNVAATKSYNADFDGDEMNMHMPQSIMAETELRHLAAIPHQQISPTSNTPIIGIFQDSLLGAYRLTRPNITFSRAEAMRLLCRYDHVDLDALEACFKKSERITSFQLLSQIFPRMSLKYETKLFDANRPEDKDKATSNNVFEVVNGEYLRGQLEKGVLGSGTKGVLHRIANDFGETACADFNDNLQNIVTEYMKTSSFSVGMSDLMADKVTEESIGKIIEKQKVEVQHVIDRVHLGIFENETAHSNLVEFETQVNNILNEATNVAGNIGHKSLSRDNRFAMIVESGSKGNRTNITQMISCLGQQNVDGKRIPYGFDSRTLPHYTKYDDSPAARGFVENSYISGLTAQELFFHAMGGRIGLIDTAVKSVTGDTRIVVVENDCVLSTEIGEWIDQRMEEHGHKVTFQTEKNMELLEVEGVFIPTVDEDGVVTWGKVTVLTRHDPGHRLYQVVTRSGRKVTVAESQSLLVWDPVGEKFLPKNSPDVNVGEFLPVTLDLVELFPDEDTLPSLVDDYLHIMTNDEYVPPDALVADRDFVRHLLAKFYSVTAYINGHTLCIKHGSQEMLDGLSMLCSRIGVFGTFHHDIFCIHGAHGKRFAQLTKCVLSNGTRLETLAWETPNHDHEWYGQHGNVVLDPIVSIHAIGVEAYPKLYDLTIPSTLNFCLANGLGVRDTSSTGYVQRRLIKGLEDLKVEYDMTVRNSKGKIIQFAYGEDGFDSTKVESQVIPLVEMSINDIYQHFDMSDDAMLTAEAKKRAKGQLSALKNKAQETVEFLIEKRDDLVTKVFKCRREKTVVLPVNFQYLIQTIQGQLGLGKHSTVDITPMEMFELVEEYWTRLNASPYVRTNPLFECMYRYFLSPRDMLTVRRFHRQGLVLLLETVLLKFKEAVVHPGEMVGVVAGQSQGEPATQLTLNTFHSSGVGSKSNVTRGVPRIEEILRLTKNPKASSMTVYLRPYEEDDKERAALYATTMQHTRLVDVVKHVQICFDPDESNTNLLEDRLLLEQFYEFERTLQTCMESDDTPAPKRSKWIVRMEFDSETLLERGLTMDDIHQAIAQSQYGSDAHCVFSDYNMDNLVFRIRMNGSVFNKNKKKVPEPLDQSDEIYLLKNFQDQLLKNVVLRGVSGIRNVQVRKVQNQVAKDEGAFVPKEAWCLDTTGSNLIATLGLSYVDPVRTFTNDIRETFHVLGIEAARQAIMNELNEVMEFSGGVYINYHHTSLLCDRMTCNKDMVSIFRSGLLNDDTGPIAKASFEVHTEVLLDAARHADVDHMRGVSASIMCGQYGSYGTGAFNLVLDTKAMEKLPSARIGGSVSDSDVEKAFAASGSKCRKDTLEIKTHLADQPVVGGAVCEDDYDAGF